MKKLVLIMFVSLLSISCGQKSFTFNSPEDLEALKQELLLKFGDQEFSSVSISAKDLTGVVQSAGGYQSVDGKSTYVSYDFDRQQMAEPVTNSIVLKNLDGSVDVPKTFKLSELDLGKLHTRFVEASDMLASENFEYVSLKSANFSEGYPVDGKLDLDSFKIQATKPGDRKKFFVIDCKVESDGKLRVTIE